MYDYTKMKVEEIRAVLVDSYGYTPEQVENMKGKAILVEALIKESGEQQDSSVDSDGFFDDSVLEHMLDEDVVEDKESGVDETKPVPEPTDVDWSDYVLSHLIEEEFFKGNPTVDGLRRIITKVLVGQVVRESITSVVKSPTHDDMTASVVHNITLEDLENGRFTTFSGAADVSPINTDKPFCRHPVATAETIAEGRALRRALKLRKVVAAEEISEVANQGEDAFQSVSDQQILAMNVIAKRLNIDMQALLRLNKYNENIRKLSITDGTSVMKLLSAMQTDTSTIDNSILGYKTDWSQ